MTQEKEQDMIRDLGQAQQDIALRHRVPYEVVKYGIMDTLADRALKYNYNGLLDAMRIAEKREDTIGWIYMTFLPWQIRELIKYAVTERPAEEARDFCVALLNRGLGD